MYSEVTGAFAAISDCPETIPGPCRNTLEQFAISMYDLTAGSISSAFHHQELCAEYQTEYLRDQTLVLQAILPYPQHGAGFEPVTGHFNPFEQLLQKLLLHALSSFTVATGQHAVYDLNV